MEANLNRSRPNLHLPKRQTTATSSDRELIKVFFDDLESRLVEEIEQASAVVGVVAWLTNPRILAALSEKRYVSILVSKQDFLRLDTHSGEKWAFELRAMYDKLRAEYIMPSKFDNPELSNFSIAKEVYPIRCVGSYGGKDRIPIAHHKFVLFCHDSLPPWEKFADEIKASGGKITNKYVAPFINEYRLLRPYAVWTGSFNFTINATRSLENAVLIKDAEIVNAYLSEYVYAFTLSEPLDWTTATANPNLETMRCEACKEIQLIDPTIIDHSIAEKATSFYSEWLATHYDNKYKKWCPICATLCEHCNSYTCQNYEECLCCGKVRGGKS